MPKVTLTIDIPDTQLAQLEDEANKSFGEWCDATLEKKPRKESYWPTPLELFAMRIVLFELRKAVKEKT